MKKKTNKMEAKKKHPKKVISEKTLHVLRVFCTRREIPWLGLNKAQVVENIYAWERDREIPHEGKLPLYEDNVGNEKIMTPRIRKFCHEYAMCKEPKSREEWAEEFGVSKSTISKWLSQDHVKKQVECFITEHEVSIKQIFEQSETEVIEELLNIIKTKKVSDVKRKAIVDFLGFAGRRNVNSVKMIMHQEQGQQQATGIAVMKNEEIDAELAELSELEDE